MLELLGMPVIENKMMPKGTAFLIVQHKGLVTQMVKVFEEKSTTTDPFWDMFRPDYNGGKEL